MNMTKCEIPKPLSRSHFHGSCWRAGKIDPLSTAFGRTVAQFLFPGNLSKFSQSELYGSFIPPVSLYLCNNQKKKREKNQRPNCEVNLISSIEAIKSNLECIMPRMNYLINWLCAKLLWVTCHSDIFTCSITAAMIHKTATVKSQASNLISNSNNIHIWLYPCKWWTELHHLTNARPEVLNFTVWFYI